MVGPGDEPYEPGAHPGDRRRGHNPFSAYYPEILKAEGLNLFTAMRARDVPAESLADRRVVLLASSLLSPAAVTARGLGARRRPHATGRRAAAAAWPATDPARHAPHRLSARYLRANPSLRISHGIVGAPLRVHAATELYAPLGHGEAPITVAQLYSDADTPLPNRRSASAASAIATAPSPSISPARSR